MQVQPTVVGHLANLHVFLMVVERFRQIEVKLGGQQHAHDKGMHHDPKPSFIPDLHWLKALMQ